MSPVFVSDVARPEPLPTKCAPSLRLSFDETDGGVAIIDTSPNRFWVNNMGVKVTGGKAFFDGNSRLSIPGFSNMDFGNKCKCANVCRTVSF